MHWDKNHHPFQLHSCKAQEPEVIPRSSGLEAPARARVRHSGGPLAPPTATRGVRRRRVLFLRTTPGTPPSGGRPETARAPAPPGCRNGSWGPAGVLHPRSTQIAPPAAARLPLPSSVPPSLPPSFPPARRRRTRCTSLGALFPLADRLIQRNFGTAAFWC
ncbi:uncharacterized protein LOC132671361 [Panthera onca]|uniref:actin nucleation-promoting factor WASL-like n=1 Tax=Panthera onca TaxID=9690 RepID=UPI0029551112|nr:actin nucleation-promoting factor WASL-like [Panthera onca]